jgi:hypothetical protein
MSEILIFILGVFIGWVVPCPHNIQVGINKVIGLIKDKINIFK